jgi:hypothetical protein
MAFAVGLLITLIGIWPIILITVPDRLDTFATVCTGLALPGIITSLAIAQNVHGGSRIVIFLGNWLVYSALAGLILLWWRRRVR